MNRKTIELVEVMSKMATTIEIAAEFDKIVEECGNLDSSAEIAAAFVLAGMRTGKTSITIKDSH